MAEMSDGQKLAGTDLRPGHAFGPTPCGVADCQLCAMLAAEAEQERQVREGIRCTGCGTRYHAAHVDLDAPCPLCLARRERDQWIRLFNRLDAAITHHKRDTNPLWAAESDEALWAARDRVLKDAAGPDTR